MRFGKLGAAVALVLLTAGPACAEDLALVVGVRAYRNLGPGARLDGVENDVSFMEQELRKAGFRVVMLLDADATRAAVLQALEQARSQVSGRDRFVYYQSSHGSKQHHLILNDTTTDLRNTLPATELRSLLQSIPTQRKSLILDACFAGGYKSRGADRVKQWDEFRPRFDQVTRVVPTTSPGTIPELRPSGGGYAVFASSQADETSLMGGELDGMSCSRFTASLVRSLRRTPGSAPWNTVVQPTVADVRNSTGGRQTPVFTDQYLGATLYTAVVGGGEAPARSNIGRYVGLLTFTNHNPGKLRIRYEADPEQFGPRGAYSPGTSLRFFVQSHESGYLFVVNRDDTDAVQMIGWRQQDLNLTSPEALVDQARIEPGGEFKVGMGTLQSRTSARDGHEYWKAYLFTNREDALAFARDWLEMTGKRAKAKLNINTWEQPNTRPSVSTATHFTAEVGYPVARQ